MSDLAADVVLRRARVDATPAAVGRVRMVACRSGPSPVDTALSAVRDDAVRQGHEEGLQTGYEEGCRRGLADAETQAAAALKSAVAEAIAPMRERDRQLQALVKSVEAAFDESLRVAEDEMIALCYEVVCRVLGRACITADGVRAQVQALVAARTAADIVAVHLHPADVEAVGEKLGALRCVADPAVTLGGCILRGSQGAMDARLDCILEEVKATLLAARAADTPGEGAA